MRKRAAFLFLSTNLISASALASASLAPLQELAKSPPRPASVSLANRKLHPFGLILGANDPSPSLLGLNLAYNLFDAARIRLGYAKLSAGVETSEIKSATPASVQTFGGGLQFLVPEWNFTPTAGIHWAEVKQSSGDTTTIGIGGFEGGGSHFYYSFGLDWQARSGFNFGFRANRSLKHGAGSSSSINLGWFFG